jgi:hypothetical protein
MKGFELLLSLREDCVFSERSATEGGHRGLSYVPGAAILGAFAARLYPDARLTPEQKFRLFQAGSVRFGNGFPVSEDGERAWPMPLCWHHDKGARWQTDDKRLLADAVYHLSGEAARDRGTQPEQMRGDFVTEQGLILSPDKALRLKTAIDPATGRAREAALFGYDALCAGQRFVARVDIDDDVDDGLVSALRDALPRPLPLGRSRSAEYGLVDVALLPLPEEHLRQTVHGVAWGDQQDVDGAERVALWLLSDLAATDPFGQPTLHPAPEWLGLPRGRLEFARSFIRSRRYSPWNAHRGGPDLERQVLCQGSLLVFDLEAPLEPAHRHRLAARLGLHREAGLGRVWLNPALLGHPGHAEDLMPRLVSGSAADRLAPAEQPGTGEPTAKSELTAWLNDRIARGGERDHAAELAREIARAYPPLLRSARRLQGLPNDAEVGPSPSQWGAVLALAKRPPRDFPAALFDTRTGPCKPSAPGWKDEYWGGAGTSSFAAWVRERLGTSPSPELVQRLAREVMHSIKQEVR